MKKHIFTKDELIEHVKKEDEIGKKIVKIETEFLKDIKNFVKVTKCRHAIGSGKRTWCKFLAKRCEHPYNQFVCKYFSP